MVVAWLVVSAVAVLVAIVSAVYVRQNAVAADRSAKAAEDSARAAKDSLAIEAARRLEERRPRLSGRIERAKGRHELTVTLESDERLSLLQLQIPPGQGVSFRPNTDSVRHTSGRRRRMVRVLPFGGFPRRHGAQRVNDLGGGGQAKLNDRTIQDRGDLPRRARRVVGVGTSRSVDRAEQDDLVPQGGGVL